MTSAAYWILSAVWLYVVLVLWAYPVCADDASKTAAQWLEVINQDPDGPSAKDERLSRFEEAAVWHANRWRLPDPERQKILREYLDWVEAEANSIVDRFIAGKSLTEKEREYLFVGIAHRVTPAKRRHPLIYEYKEPPVDPEGAFVYGIIRRGLTLLAKGYSGQSLTAQDIFDLQVFHLWQGLRMGAAYFKPGNVGMSWKAEFKPGDELPDFRIRTLESALASPKFSDTNLHPGWTTHFKPKGIIRYLQMFDGYVPIQQTGGRIACFPKCAQPGPTPEGWIRLSDYRGKKPVVLIVSDMKDVFFRHTWSAMDPLWRGYRDKVQFFVVNSSFADWWFLKAYFGSSVDSYYLTHEMSAQVAKRACMRWPSVSVPVLLDDPARSVGGTLGGAGGSRFYIIDIDGELAYREQAHNAWDVVLWANELEIELNHVLANDGRRDTKRPKDYKNPVVTYMEDLEFRGRMMDGRSHWSGYHEWPSGKWSACQWVSGTVIDMQRMPRRPGENGYTAQRKIIVRVDSTAAEMQGYRFNKAAKGRAKLDDWAELNQKLATSWAEGEEKDRTYALLVGPDTHVFVNGWPKGFAGIAVGDHVGVRYGYLPDVLKDPDNPDSKNFEETPTSRTPEGYLQLEPEQVRVARPGWEPGSGGIEANVLGK